MKNRLRWYMGPEGDRAFLDNGFTLFLQTRSLWDDGKKVVSLQLGDQSIIIGGAADVREAEEVLTDWARNIVQRTA
jgi:hypothetical protein